MVADSVDMVHGRRQVCILYEQASLYLQHMQHFCGECRRTWVLNSEAAGGCGNRPADPCVCC